MPEFLTDSSSSLDSAKRTLATARSWGRSWWDGLWLCIGFLIACGAVTIPVTLLGILEKAAGGYTAAFLQLLQVAFVLFVGPVIVSRVFRALDDPGRPPRGHTPQPEETRGQ